MMHKIVNNVAPTYLTNKIRYHNNIHSYNTRNKNKIVMGISRTASYDRSFFPTFSRLYNDLNSVKNCFTSSITAIKKHAKQFVTSDVHPRRVRKNIFGKEKKIWAQRTLSSPEENVRRGLPPHFQLKLQSVKLPKMWFFSFLVHPVYYADAIFSWKVCIVSFSNCFCNLISSDVMSI